ncbi:hypothetical protein BN1423_1090011 [Carnobacterium maltaromaticum]|nr:hypothetical protein IV76_GL001431 [Carnobacterium maltaromaticum]CRH19249.1 hypothetical protein CM318V1_440057 [Carnobacterium maltaromaticum]CRH20696.1 hypothetical protein BN1423_1090011 [Carnobacterium maltaromaticum]
MRFKYKNLKTGEINFYDAKMKVSIPKDLKIRNGITEDFLDYRFKRFIIYF